MPVRSDMLGVLTEDALPPLESTRPTTRADCMPGGPRHVRPCPWISCRHHVVGVHEGGCVGRLGDSFITSLPWRDDDATSGARTSDDPEFIERVADAVVALPHSCTLDLAERDGMTLEEVGQVLRITRERVRQIEKNGKEMLRSQRRRRMLEAAR